MLFCFFFLPSSSQTLLFRPCTEHNNIFFLFSHNKPPLDPIHNILPSQKPHLLFLSFARQFSIPPYISTTTTPREKISHTHTKMSRTMLHLVDPPQSTSKSTYTHTGIGGAGNVRRLPPPSSVPATTIATASHNHHHHDPLTTINSHISHTSSTKSSSNNNNNYYARFSTGRGGAGNIPPPGSCRAIFSLDEEEEMQRRARPAPITYHTGRGGEGNRVRRESIESSGSDPHSPSRNMASTSPGTTTTTHRRSGDSKRSLDLARAWLKRW